MATTEKTIITVSAFINAPVEKVWNYWTTPSNVERWNFASTDWLCPKAENDLRQGGKFSYRMESRDGSYGFDFWGTYSRIEQNRLIESVLGDGRSLLVTFEKSDNGTVVTEKFEAETENPAEMQKVGWQAILDNFRKHAESMNKMNRMHFEIAISAPVDKVWNTMLDENTFREWTSEFNPHSYYKGSWNKGSKIHFIGSDPDGNMGGMVSRIRENIQNRFVSIEHLGILKGEEEITSGPEVDGWAGALENYTFAEKNGQTVVSVDVDTSHEFANYFTETWPRALNKLKAVAEK
jgi:uncharacterized protein YndB with AHSA1/START domain